MRKIRECPEQQMLTRASRDSADRSEIDQQSVTILRITPPCISRRTLEHCYSSQFLTQSQVDATADRLSDSGASKRGLLNEPLYDVHWERGTSRWRILLSADDKIASAILDWDRPNSALVSLVP